MIREGELEKSCWFKGIMTLCHSVDFETRTGYDIFLTARKTMNEFDVFFLFVGHENVHITQYDKMGYKTEYELCATVSAFEYGISHSILLESRVSAFKTRKN
jgi:hypothetical protein